MYALSLLSQACTFSRWMFPPPSVNFSSGMQFMCMCLNAGIRTDVHYLKRGIEIPVVMLPLCYALSLFFIPLMSFFSPTPIPGQYLLPHFSSRVNKLCIPAVSMSAYVPAHCNLSLIVSSSGGIGWGCIIASN